MKITLLILVLVALPRSAQTQSIVIDNGNTVQLCGACESRRVRLSVTAKDFVVKKDQVPVVSEVASGNVRLEEWKNWITPTWEPADGVPVALVLNVDTALDRAGTYDVLLLLRQDMPKLKLQLVQAAGQLDVPDKLLIERTQGWPWSDPDTPLPALGVRELTGATSVTSITFASKQAMQGSQGVSGRLVPRAAGAGKASDSTVTMATGVIVPAGGPAEIPYALQGEFPRGVVTGVVRLLAPQLSQPVVLNYEVRTRLTDLWILVAVGVGLLLGYIVRIRLQGRIVLAEARQRAMAVLRMIDDRLAQYDKTVSSDIAQKRQDAVAAAQGTDVARITAEVSALEDKWKSALGEYERRYGDAKAKFLQLEQLLSLPWMVPKAIAAALQAWKTTLADASSRLTARQADEALNALQQLARTMARSLRIEGTSWQRSALGLIDGLKAATAGIPEPVRSQFATQVPPELDRVKEQEIAPDESALRATLADLESELGGFDELMQSLKARAEREWQDFEAALRGAPPLPKPEALTALRDAYAGFVSLLAGSPAEPSDLRRTLQQDLQALQSAWATGIRSQLSPGQQNPQIEQAIKDRDFVAAGRALSAVLQGLQPVLRGTGTAPAPKAADWISVSLPLLSHASAPLTGVVVERGAVISGLPSAAVERELTATRLLQTVAVGALMALWAFSVYAKDFDGTLTGLLTPFFATFLLDISVEGLKGQVKTK